MTNARPTPRPPAWLAPSLWRQWRTLARGIDEPPDHATGELLALFVNAGQRVSEAARRVETEGITRRSATGRVWVSDAVREQVRATHEVARLYHLLGFDRRRRPPS
jgi:phage terminase small subunit